MQGEEHRAAVTAVNTQIKCDIKQSFNRSLCMNQWVNPQNAGLFCKF